MPTLLHLHSPSSNKTGIVDLAEVAYLLKEANAAILKPKIDKISVTYDLRHLAHLTHEEKNQIHASIEQNLWDFVKDEDTPYSPAKKGKAPFRYRTNVVWTNPSGDGSVLIQAKPTKVKPPQRFFRLEFNPSILQHSGLDEFSTHWHALCHGDSDLKDIAEAGIVTRLDIAVDILGVTISDMIIRAEQPAKTHLYFSELGVVETLYVVHKAKKPSPVSAYNKRKQLEASKADEKYGGVPYTRIEIRYALQRPITKLGKLKNRFADLSVATPRVHRPENVPNHLWGWFLDSVRHRGVDAACSIAPDPEMGGSLRQGLEKAHAAFWNPKQIWQHWPESLTKSGLLGT
jgi:hypothetical protein